jgi:DNA replication protein DnaC
VLPKPAKLICSRQACREGFSVLYRRAPRLFADLATARGEGRLARQMTALERARLLIIDLCAARSDVEVVITFAL